MQAAHARSRDAATLRRERKARARRARKTKKQTIKALEAFQDGTVVSKHKHLTDCRRARRWLHAQLLRADRGGVGGEARKELRGFWRRGGWGDVSCFSLF
ncbi:MAG: hypothetical protein Q9195_000849 [Heterodermia aff. obscurata]